MLRKTAVTVAAGGSLLLAQGVAVAAEEVGQAYLKGMGTYIAADSDRSVDDEVVGGLVGFGYALHQNLNIELDINFLQLSGKGSTSTTVDGGEGGPITTVTGIPDQDQTAINLNLMPMLNRDGIVSPYALLGIGWVNTDIDGNRDKDDLQLQAGVGALWKLYGRRLSLRTEVLNRFQDGGYRRISDESQGFTGSSLNDWLINVGFQVALGSKAAPMAAAAPVAAAAAPAAPPPPPPPPPPPADSDGDGVIDSLDKCPDTPAGARVDAQGCEQVSLRLTFGNDSASLTADDKAQLDEVIARLKLRTTPIKIRIEGHTDSNGAEAYNQRLSERRAAAVKDYIAAGGIAADSLSTVGYGETRPEADNATAEGRAQNRRVVLQRIFD